MGGGDNLSILKELLSAWRKANETGDFQAFLNGLAEDVEWFAPGPPEIIPWAGTYRGREGWMRWRKLLNETVEYKKFETVKFVAEGDTVVQFIHATDIAKATGRTYESGIARVWTFRDGKVVKVQNYIDTYAYVRAISGM